MSSLDTDDISRLPPDLPIPIDDGACDHLPGMRLPDIALRSTSGRDVVLVRLD
jgi:peroxiredoxin (alkyl hydroperoxide reductase subunit C)